MLPLNLYLSWTCLVVSIGLFLSHFVCFHTMEYVTIYTHAQDMQWFCLPHPPPFGGISMPEVVLCCCAIKNEWKEIYSILRKGHYKSRIVQWRLLFSQKSQFKISGIPA